MPCTSIGHEGSPSRKRGWGLCGFEAYLALELLHKVVDGAVVEVLAAQVGVAGGGLDLEDTLLDGQERHVEGAAAEVEDEDVALRRGLLVEAVRDRRRGRLVDDAQHVEAGDRARVLGGGALRVVEVGRHGDDGVGDVLAEVGLGGLAHLDEHHRGDLLREELLRLALVLDLDGRAVALLGEHLEGEVLHVALGGRVGELAADEALGVEDGVRGVHRRLVLRGVADHALRLREGDERGRRAVALVVGDDLNAVVLPDADARVGGAQVDADRRSLNLAVLAHVCWWYCFCFACGWGMGWCVFAFVPLRGRVWGARATRIARRMCARQEAATGRRGGHGVSRGSSEDARGAWYGSCGGGRDAMRWWWRCRPP